jgi:HK97 family phage major capsid protein
MPEEFEGITIDKDIKVDIEKGDETKRHFQPNVGGGVDRDKLKDSDFVFSDERKFPIVTAKDVKDAVHSWGRYKGSHSFEEFKRRLTSLAKRKGFESSLPDKWPEGKSLSFSVGQYNITIDDEDKSLDDEEPEDDEEEEVDKPDEDEVIDEPVKAFDLNETVVAYGGEVKSLSNGNIGGYLVRFSTENDPDLVGDFFTTDTDFGDHKTIPVYYNHGLDGKIGIKKIGKGLLSKDEIGVWVEMQANKHDEYIKEYVKGIEQKLIPEGKLGWSSGTAAHLVRREVIGNANKILSWPLGDDASLTPTPAEPRNVAVSLKSLVVPTEDTQEVLENNTGVVVNDSENLEIKKDIQEEVFKMDEETKKFITDALEENKKSIAEAVKAAIPEPAGAEVVKTAPVVLKDQLGDSGIKSMEAYIRSGGRNVDHNLKSEDQWADKSALKVNDYQEDSNANGLITVPPDYWNKIVEFRDEKSIIRQAPAANIVRTSSNRVEVPVQYGKETKLAQTTEYSGAADQTTTIPFAAVEVNIYTWTRYFPISNQLLHDNKFDVMGHIARRAGHASARTENANILVGDGSGHPQGVMVGGTAGATSAAGASVAAADIWNLSGALPAWYWDEACWVGRWATFNKIYQIQTTAGIYGFLPIGGPGEFAKDLLGKPVFFTDEIAAVAINAKELLLGNFEYLAFAENEGFQMTVNPYDDMVHNNTNIYCVQRFGCKVALAEAFQYLTGATA